MQLVQSHKVPDLDAKLSKVLDLLPPAPRRWANEVSANRDIKSMPPNSRLDLDSPVPPPRHNKLKKAISIGGPVIVSLIKNKSIQCLAIMAGYIFHTLIKPS